VAKFINVLFGIALGFLFAHLVNATPQGKEFFARAGATVSGFVSGVRDAYRP
jgi:hypothetical protein